MLFLVRGQVGWLSPQIVQSMEKVLHSRTGIDTAGAQGNRCVGCPKCFADAAVGVQVKYKQHTGREVKGTCLGVTGGKPLWEGKSLGLKGQKVHNFPNGSGLSGGREVREESFDYNVDHAACAVHIVTYAVSRGNAPQVGPESWPGGKVGVGGQLVPPCGGGGIA